MGNGGRWCRTGLSISQSVQDVCNAEHMAGANGTNKETNQAVIQASKEIMRSSLVMSSEHAAGETV